MAQDPDIDRLCIDLFSGTNSFSRAFEKSREWDVITVDKRTDHDEINPSMPADVFELTPADFPLDEYGTVVVLASPPCKAFSMAAAGHHMTKEVEPKTDFGEMSIDLVQHTLSLIDDMDPDYWFLENPRAGMRRVMRRKDWGAGEPTGTVSWCQYGANRMKPTDFWGDHPPMTYRMCANGEDCHASAPRGARTGTQGIDTDVKRGAIPFGISLAILEAVERDI